MILSPDRIQYLELRATTDCLLGLFRADAVEFFGADAEKVAGACGLPLTHRGEDVKGVPLAVCGFPASLIPPGEDGDRAGWILRFSADFRDAICGAGYPFAVACALPFDSDEQALLILSEWRPRLDRPPLRVV